MIITRKPSSSLLIVVRQITQNLKTLYSNSSVTGVAQVVTIAQGISQHSDKSNIILMCEVCRAQ